MNEVNLMGFDGELTLGFEVLPSPSEPCLIRIEVQAQDYRGAGQLVATAAEASEFMWELESALTALTGTVQLTSLEGASFVTFTFGNMGRVHVAGRIGTPNAAETHLHFSFDTDQSYFPTFFARLSELLVQGTRGSLA
ncbi:MAG: WapI family immunity protein [Fimbriimonadales bacterium]